MVNNCVIQTLAPTLQPQIQQPQPLQPIPSCPSQCLPACESSCIQVHLPNPFLNPIIPLCLSMYAQLLQSASAPPLQPVAPPPAIPMQTIQINIESIACPCQQQCVMLLSIESELFGFN